MKTILKEAQEIYVLIYSMLNSFESPPIHDWSARDIIDEAEYIMETRGYRDIPSKEIKQLRALISKWNDKINKANGYL